ncbi:MAG: type II toxin-antitoxin system VapC family toxin [Polaromonas sp.]
MITAGHQATTYQWWEQHRRDFELVISQFVVDECSAGDPAAAQRRLVTIDGLALLDASHPDVESLAKALIHAGALPAKAFIDASHIAVCAVAGVEMLLTWNFKHIANGANGAMMKKIQAVCTANGFECPQLLTPLQLLGGDDVD